MTDLNETIIRYEKELLESIVPFWETSCIDWQNGGFYNFIDRKGKVFDTGKYMWMQWRIVYMFATLFNSEYSRYRWLEYAQQGFDFLLRCGRRENGAYFFALDAGGLPTKSDCAGFAIFSESFAAIACAELFKATGEYKYRQEAVSAFNIYLNNVRKSSEGNSFYGAKPRLVLGHHMILVNVCNIMGDCLKTNDYDTFASEAVNKIFSFWHPALDLMFENINIDDSFDLDSADGRILNPGHAMEAMWFIMEYAERKKDYELGSKAVILTGKILEYGWDQKFGGIFYFKDACGLPLLEPKSCLKIWWAHNEAAIAALYAYKLSSQQSFADWFKQIDVWSWKHFRDPDYPEWFGYTFPNGEPCHFFKGSNWKTFFHLPRCLLMCINILKSLKKPL